MRTISIIIVLLTVSMVLQGCATTKTATKEKELDKFIKASAADIAKRLGLKKR